MGNIFSNIKAQGQKIYSSTKGLIAEEGLIQNSLNQAIDKVGEEHQGDYLKALKMLNGNGNTAALNEMVKVKGQALKKTPNTVSILGNSLDQDNISKVGQTVSNRLASAVPGFGYSNMDKAYSKIMRKTKGAIGMNMAGNIAGNYYINPLKDGINAMKTTGFKDNTNLHKGIARIGGTSLSVAALGGVIGSTLNDEDLKQTNSKLRTMYDIHEIFRGGCN